MLRAALTAVLAFSVLVSTVAPHVHDGAAPERQDCVGCATARAGAAPVAAAPDVAPKCTHEERLAVEPGLPPISGAPLGAIPGQSPPVA